MAQSYTRQSTFADGDTISASLFNNEYNQLVNSFAYSSSSAVNTGHRHDGTAGQGGNIPKIGDLDFLNKIEVDSTNNRWGFYVEVSSAAVEQIRIQDGAIVPVTDNDIDLGTSSLQFKDLFINGTANIDSLVLSSGSTVTAILDEDGLTSNSATSLATQQSIKAYVDAQVTAQDLDFSADSGGALSIDLDSESLTFTGGTGIDTSGSGNAVTFAIDSTVTTLTGSQTLTNKTLTSPDINGGTVDGATIATSDITVGTGKTLDVSAGTLTLADNQISGDKVEGGTINAVTVNTLTYGSLSDGSITITAFVDEDNMASDSATLVPTQQSVKAYVDSQVTAQDLDVTTDSGTIAIDLDSETLTVAGGTGLSSSATGNAVTIDIDSTVATLTGSQTLSNKTLATPVVSGNLTTNGLIDGRDVATDGTKLDGIESGATADQTASEIKTAYESNADTNAFTDADHSKLDGIEASADVTDTTNVTAAGALMDSELTSEASVKALNQGVATTDSPSFAGLTVDTSTLKVDSTNNRVGIGNASPDVSLDLGSNTDSIHVPVGTTAQRPGSPAAGYFRYNTSLAQFEGYTDAWGAIGGGGTNTFTTDSFTGNGSTTAYALSQAVASEDNLLVFIEGVFQQQNAYSIATSGGVTTLTFSTAPANSNSILVYSVAAGVSGSNLNIDSMTGDGSDTTLTLTINPVNENNTQVFIDGVYQNKSTYSISGTTLTFSTAPPSGSAVEVMTMTQTDINVPVDNSITSAKLSGNLVTPGALDVTGTVTADGLTVDGVGSVSANTTSNAGSIYNANTSGTVLKLRSGSVGGTTAVLGIFDGNNNEKARFTASGRLGIGTSSPSELLHINRASGTGAYIRIQDDTGGNYIGTDGGVLQFFDGSASEKMRIDASGNVGIGTTSPFFTTSGRTSLSVNGSTSSILAFGKGGSSENYILADAGGLTIANTSTTLPTIFFNNASEAMRIDSSGRVGIGTNSPSQPLHVDATGGTTAALFDNNGTNGDVVRVGKNGTDILKIRAEGAADVALDANGGAFIFKEGGSEAMRIDASGNVGIGTTSASARLHVPSSADDTRTSILASGVTGDPNFQLAAWSGTGGLGSGTEVVRVGLGYGATKNSYIHFHRGPSTTGGFMSFSTNNGTERMRIDSSGNLLVGTASGFGGLINAPVTTSDEAMVTQSNSTSTSTHLNFRNPNGFVGSISTSASATTFNTSSDQRLKENIVDADDAGSKIDAIQVRKFDWKADGSHQDYGMVAQELQGVAPEAVSAPEDPEEMMGVDYSKLVPMMIKEIQSLRKEVAALKENN
jgi:hypothetical protein